MLIVDARHVEHLSAYHVVEQTRVYVQPEDSVAEHCEDIIDKWTELTSDAADLSAAAAATSSLDTKIHLLIEQQTASSTSTGSGRTAGGVDADERCKKAILAQYADVSDGEEYPWFIVILTNLLSKHVIKQSTIGEAIKLDS